MRLLLVFVFLALTSFADAYTMYLLPSKQPGTEIVFRKGEPYLRSKKNVQITVAQLDHVLRKDRASFSFSMMNTTGNPITMMPHNLRVTDQYGRRIRVVSKSELVRNAENRAWWKRAVSGALLVLDHVNAEENAKSRSRLKAVETQTEMRPCGETTFSHRVIEAKEDSYDRYAAWRGHQAANDDAARREALISREQRRKTVGYLDYYLDANTIFPGETYAANFQIALPPQIKRQLDVLLISFDVAGEEHTFCFSCR